MKVLVTGANGFVGGHLCPMLESSDCEVVRGTREIVGNIDGRTDWLDALRGVDAVVHLAARAHILKETAVDPLEAFREVNLAGTLNLAQQAGSCGVTRFVFISSIGVHGLLSTGGSFSVSDELIPHDPYSASKLEAEQGLRQIAEETGLELVSIRPPLMYGPGVGANFLRLMKLAASGIPLPLGSVKNRRSFVYVGNLCDLIFQCLENPAAAGEIFLVSDDHDVSTPDLLRLLATAQGKPARLFPFPVSLLKWAGRLAGRSAEIERLCGSLQVDIKHTKEMIGWEPPFEMEQGIRETVAAHQVEQSAIGNK